MLELFDPANPPGIYIHIPFCQYKCAYCGFYSISCGRNTDTSGYFRRLISELKEAIFYFKKPFKTAYIGGGTPNLAQNFSYVREIIALLKGVEELTVECNVSSLSTAQLEFFKDNVTRLSVGVQSFDKDTRDNLCRFDALDNLKMLLEFRKSAENFPLLNLDFITAITAEDTFSKNFLLFADFCRENSYELPEHISLYALSIEDGSTYKDLVRRGRRKAVDDDKAAEILKSGWDTLEHCGYEHYEVSAFALGGNYCRHNTGYWKLSSYLGIGAGAASRAFYHGDFEIRMADDWQKYAAGEVFTGYEASPLSKKDVALEIVLAGLRIKFGVCVDDFYRRTGYNLSELSSGLDGLVIEDGVLKVLQKDMIMCESYIRRLAFRIIDKA